jgi:dihydrofolate reductase
MEYSLYMAISADGYIAQIDDETPWSDAEWDSFLNKAKEFGNLILGRRTYEMMMDDGVFDDMPEMTVVILSRQVHTATHDNHFFVHTLAEVDQVLAGEGLHKGLVAGGTQINSLFLDRISELFLDVEPVILGNGLRLFEKQNFLKELQLVQSRTIGSSGVQLHYRLTAAS